MLLFYTCFFFQPVKLEWGEAEKRSYNGTEHKFNSVFWSILETVVPAIIPLTETGQEELWGEGREIYLPAAEYLTFYLEEEEEVAKAAKPFSPSPSVFLPNTVSCLGDYPPRCDASWEIEHL